jgi:outer membrane protein insertion porin family
VFLALILCPVTTYAQDIEAEKPDRIWKVDIEGNESFEDLVIKKYISNEQPSVWKKITFFARDGYLVSETEIRKDVIRIERFYKRRGFNDVRVTYRLESLRKEWKKKLVFEVIENTPIKISSVQVDIETKTSDSEGIREDDGFKSTIRRLPYRPQRIFEPVEEPEVIGLIDKRLKNMGYPYVNTSVEASVDTLSKKADITLKINTGPQARFDSLIIEGESTLEEKYIERETGIEKGDLFSENKMREAQREVFKHHLFRLALISIPTQSQDSTLDVLMRVKELPLRSVQLRAGAGDFDRLNDPFGINNFYKPLRTQASWVYRNVRGKGERFSVTGRLSYYQRKLSAEYLFPYVYNTKSSINIEPYYEFRDEENYNILTGGVFTTFGYEYSQNLTGTFSYEFGLTDERNVSQSATIDNEDILPDSLLSYNVSSFGISFYYTKNLRRGRSGLIVQPSLELSGIFGESTYSYQKASLEITKYTPVNNSLVLATRVQGGGILNVRQDSLPSDIRFYSGGARTVRGWDRRYLGPKREVETIDSTKSPPETSFRYVPRGGRTFFNFNIELRQQLDGLIKGFGVAAFLDGGQVWRRLDEVSPSDLQFGIGGGIRYQSPIGPIRADIGYKVNPTPADLNQFGNQDLGTRWDRWAIHISIGQAF